MIIFCPGIKKKNKTIIHTQLNLTHGLPFIWRVNEIENEKIYFSGFPEKYNSKFIILNKFILFNEFCSLYFTKNTYETARLIDFYLKYIELLLLYNDLGYKIQFNNINCALSNDFYIDIGFKKFIYKDERGRLKSTNIFKIYEEFCRSNS